MRAACRRAQATFELTAYLARTEPDPYLKQAFDFGLLEDFDHLYRFSQLLDLLHGKDPDEILQGRTDVMDPTETWLERWVLHEFVECANYYTCHTTETDRRLKDVWELFLGELRVKTLDREQAPNTVPARYQDLAPFRRDVRPGDGRCPPAAGSRAADMSRAASDRSDLRPAIMATARGHDRRAGVVS